MFIIITFFVSFMPVLQYYVVVVDGLSIVGEDDRRSYDDRIPFSFHVKLH